MWPHCTWDALQGHPGLWIGEVGENPLQVLMDSMKTGPRRVLGFLGKGPTSLGGCPSTHPCPLLLSQVAVVAAESHLSTLLEMLLFLSQHQPVCLKMA